MPDTRITKQKLKDHWGYSGKAYIIGALVAVALASMFFTMVTNREPADKYSVNFAIVRSYSNTEQLNGVSDELLRLGQEVDPELKAVKFTSIMFEGDMNSQEAYNYYQLYILQLSAGSNDFFLQTEAMTKSLLQGGNLRPLEEVEYFEQFVQNHPEAEIMWEKEPLPDGVEAVSARRVIRKSPGGNYLPCWELTIGDGEARVYVDARSGRQCAVEIGT